MSEDKNGKNTKRVVYLIGDITEEKSLGFIDKIIDSFTDIEVKGW